MRDEKLLKKISPLAFSLIFLSSFLSENISANNYSSYQNKNNTIVKKRDLMNIIIEDYENKNIREKLKNTAMENFSCYLFGNFLNNVESKLKNYSKNDNIKNFRFKIPDNFMVNNMDMSIKINKKNLQMFLYQNYDSKKILLLDAPVALGMKGKRFSTPSGKFFLKRVIKNPVWFPPLWSRITKPVKPGKRNPFGLWMSELSHNNKSESYDWGISGDSSIRIHSTNNPKSIGSYSSHGCIRIHPDVAEEFFKAILYYSSHKNGKKNGRGIIYPLENPIPITIE